MTRPKAGINAYKDVETHWITMGTRQSLTLKTASPKKATELQWRLNAYRMRDRERSGTGESGYDMFIVRKVDNLVIIERRPQVFACEAFDEHGNPVDLNKIAEDLKEFNNQEHAREIGFTMPVERPKPIERPKVVIRPETPGTYNAEGDFRYEAPPPDPKKPLIDTNE